MTDWAFSWPISANAHTLSGYVLVLLCTSAREEKQTLVVVDDVAEMVAARVVGFAHAHGVVRQVDVAVVAYVKPFCQSRRNGGGEEGRIRSGLTED